VGSLETGDEPSVLKVPKVQKATRRLISAEPIGCAQNVALPSAYLANTRRKRPRVAIARPNLSK
jgi:hypothetical protein